jgi:hypothetical protein
MRNVTSFMLSFCMLLSGFLSMKPTPAAAQEFFNPAQLAAQTLVLAWTVSGYVLMTAADAVRSGISAVTRADATQQTWRVQCWERGSPNWLTVDEDWGGNHEGCRNHALGLSRNPKYARDHGYKPGMGCVCNPF